MGLESSRHCDLPENIDIKYDQYATSWTPKIISSIGTSKCVIDKSTLFPSTLEKAGLHLATYLNNNLEWASGVNILEPFAGNGIGSKIIYDTLNKHITLQSTTISIKSTDIQDLTQYITSNSHPVEFGLNSVETIKKYGSDGYNILMMISPPPCATMNEHDLPKTFGYGDYFAIREWENIPSAKLLVFVGELGASDGSEGLYKYLIENNPNWKLESRQIIYLGNDCFGLNVEKEIFIFKKL